MQTQYRFSVRKFIIFIVSLLVIGGLAYMAFRPKNQQVPTGQSLDQFATAAPQQPGNVISTAVPLQQAGDPSQPQAVAAGKYPVLCQAGDGKTPLNVSMDAYGGFYPVVYRIVAMPASDHYCINFFPKWYGPNYDINGWDENVVENKLKSSELDVYFASNGALSLYDQNSALVVWSTDQSAGADKIVAQNYVATGPKPSFNDALGRSIMVSPGNADHFLVLKMMQSIGLTPSDTYIIYPQDGRGPVDNFNSGNGDFVAYWEPLVNDAIGPNSTVLVSTKWWRTLTDYVVISHQADEQKTEAVAYFLSDINVATQYFTKDNLAQTAQVMASFEFDGYNMADWMFINPATAFTDLSFQMENVALATLNDNAVMFQTDPTGSNLVIDQLVKSNRTWTYGEVFSNGNSGSLFNGSKMVSSKYVAMLLNGNALQVRGEFNNAYDTTEQTKPPQVNSNTLITLPELLTLPYKNIQFVQNQANMLVPGEEEKLLKMTEAIANLMSESDDTVLVIRGGAGGFSTNAAEMDFIRKFAFRRSQYIQQLLANELGIPIQRIIVDPNVLVPDHQPSLDELDSYVVVIIKVVNSQDALNK